MLALPVGFSGLEKPWKFNEVKGGQLWRKRSLPMSVSRRMAGAGCFSSGRAWSGRPEWWVWDPRFLPPGPGTIFGLTLLWAPILTIFIKFFMTELIGRYTVATGENAVSAFGRIGLHVGPLRLPTGWILWIFWLFFIVSIVGMSGVTLTVGSTLQGLFPRFSYVVRALPGCPAGCRPDLVLRQLSQPSVCFTSPGSCNYIFHCLCRGQNTPSSGDSLAGLMIRVPADSLQELVPLLGWSWCYWNSVVFHVDSGQRQGSSQGRNGSSAW